MPTTNAERDNPIARILGLADLKNVDANRVALQLSPFNRFTEGVSTHPYGNSLEFQFNEGTTIPRGLVLTEEGTTTAAATYGAGLGGVATITSDDVAAKTDQLTTGLLWEPDRQSTGYPLIINCRWKTGATITASEYWIGLTDNNPDTDPIALSTTSTFTTSVPTDGVYMGYSATPTSGAAFTTGGNQHTCLAIKADANTVVGTGGGAFVAATYYNYRIEVDVTGDTRYYLNGTLLFSQTAALTVTAPLCLMVCASPRTTVSAAISVDFMGIYGA